MLNIVLFGAGWDGEVLDVGSYSPVIKATNQTFRHLKSCGGAPIFEDAEFEVSEYKLGDKIYLVGVHGKRPSDKIIEQAITHGSRIPKPFKTL